MVSVEALVLTPRVNVPNSTVFGVLLRLPMLRVTQLGFRHATSVLGHHYAISRTFVYCHAMVMPLSNALKG